MSKVESYIAHIIELLQSGLVERGEVMATFGKKWQVGDRTFDRYWKIAQERHKEAQILINKERDVLYKQKEIDSKKAQLLSRDERLKIADDIAKGNARKIKIGGKDELLIPTSGDQLKALDYLAKVHGDYAPSKQDVTLNEGFKIVIKKNKC